MRGQKSIPGCWRGPDMIVIDLTANTALGQIQTLRANFTGIKILVFGLHTDWGAFKQAREAGATSQVDRGKVVERILKRLKG